MAAFEYDKSLLICYSEQFIVKLITERENSITVEISITRQKLCFLTVHLKCGG